MRPPTIGSSRKEAIAQKSSLPRSRATYASSRSPLSSSKTSAIIAKTRFAISTSLVDNLTVRLPGPAGRGVRSEVGFVFAAIDTDSPIALARAQSLFVGGVEKSRRTARAGMDRGAKSLVSEAQTSDPVAMEAVTEPEVAAVRDRVQIHILVGCSDARDVGQIHLAVVERIRSEYLARGIRSELYVLRTLHRAGRSYDA